MSSGPGSGDPLALARARAADHGLPLMAEGDWPERIVLPKGLSLRFLRTAMVLPLGLDDAGAERVALADPGDSAALEALRAVVGRRLAPRVASVPAILARIDALAGGMVAEAPVNHDARDEADDDRALDAPVIALLDRMLAQAVADRATDLHFEPGPQGVAVRQRVDGLLRPLSNLTPATGRAVVARLKILAGLNIAERRLPQDGHIRAFISGATYDLRCATLPMVDGEGAAVRILAGRQSLPRVAGLGMEPGAEARLRAGLAQSHGLILVTGPTGSGKTTTLAAATAELNDPKVKIISIEDPVEYHIPGIAQVQVNPGIGLTFGTGLRAFMRADPDVLLVGEVRDAETANITVQAALTGHLVLTTLHTNSASGAVVRLAEMGVEPYLLAATLRVSVGQRLVRRLCPHCRQPVNEALPLPEAALGRAGIAPGQAVAAFRAVGCDQCGQTGYYGRRAIFEVLSMTEPLRRLLLAGADTASLHAAAVGEGMAPLIDDGLAQVLAGVTSVEEVLRVVQDG
jgi:general secretion pathway protein E